MDSILVYSKYSNNSKRLIDLIQNSNVDFSGLKSLCVDNDKIRKRIKQNPHLDVTTVPCILNIYANGTVEKFEGAYAFSWVEKIIALNAPKVQEQYVAPIAQPMPQQQIPQYQPMLPQQNMVQQLPQQNMVQQVPQQQGMPTQAERQDYVPQSLEKKQKPRRKPIQQKQELTPLDELDENDQETEQNDRYRNVPGPKRIRNSHQGYEEDDDLFPGDQVDNRREKKNTIRNNTEKAISDPHGTAAKAREIEQMRNQEMESSMQNRPMELRRP